MNFLAVCLVGSPNPSNPVHCMENDICRKDYQCTRSGNQQYCCPAPGLFILAQNER